MVFSSTVSPTDPARTWICWTLGPAYAGFGVFHLMATARFMPIMPGWVPWPWQVIQFTGLCEIAGGLGLLVPRLRRWAGIGLALYAVCVFPANLHHAFDQVEVPGLPGSWWYHGPRLLLQPVLVWLALAAAGMGVRSDAPGRPRLARGRVRTLGGAQMVKADYWDVTDAQVMEKTGQPIGHWMSVLEGSGARDRPPGESVDLLQKTHGVPRYWARTLTTRYLKQQG